jgi:hypothetical protein
VPSPDHQLSEPFKANYTAPDVTEVDSI